jgi:hypothetical protein
VDDWRRVEGGVYQGRDEVGDIMAKPGECRKWGGIDPPKTPKESKVKNWLKRNIGFCLSLVVNTICVFAFNWPFIGYISMGVALGVLGCSFDLAWDLRREQKELEAISKQAKTQIPKLQSPPLDGYVRVLDPSLEEEAMAEVEALLADHNNPSKRIL